MSQPLRMNWPAAAREAGLAAFVALMLTIPMVGFRTIDRPTGLELGTRFDQVAAAVVLVFVGRLLLVMTAGGLAGPALVLSLGAAVLGAYLPLPSKALQVMLIGGGLCLAAQAGWLLVKSRFIGGDDRPLATKEPSGEKKGGYAPSLIARIERWAVPLGVLFAFIYPLLPSSGRQGIDIGILLLTYIMLGWGLNIVVGLAGLLDLGYVAFYAVGAYSYALLAVNFGLSFWVCLPLAGVLAALFGLLLGFPVLRLRGDYFAIVTLGFGEIIRVILVNWYPVTGGPNGVIGIPRPSFFGIAEFSRTSTTGLPTFHSMFGLEFDSLHRIIFLYYLILLLALLVNVFTQRIRRLPLGRAWEALREDDIACTALGINRTALKLAAFAIAATFAGFAGSFFATRQGFISPESFTFIESAIILAIVVLGGMGSQLGVVVATLLVIGVPEAFRELEQYRMLAFGAGMVVIMLWRPRGLLAYREPTMLLHGKGGLLNKALTSQAGAGR